MQAGRDQSWARPYTPNVDPEESHGSHRGDYECLNYRNPRPGFHYAYGHIGDPGGFTRMQSTGFRPVPKDNSDGTCLAAELPQMFGAPQDQFVGMGKLVLMEIPLDQYAISQQRLEEQRAIALAGPTQNFLDQGAGFDREYGRKAARVGAVYALPEHGATGYHMLSGDGKEEF